MTKVLFFLVALAVPFFAQASEFTRLMGGETSHWIHVSRKADIDLLEQLEEIYEKHKHLRFTDEGEYRIPKVAHFIWLGPRPFPAESVENIRSWIALHPDWKVKLWTDRERLAPCKSMEICKVSDFPFLFLRHCFIEASNWGEKADIFRFELLYQEGGVSLDHDVQCLKSFDGLHRGFDFYCGLNVPHPPIAGKNITSGNCLIGAHSFHPVIGKVMELIGKDWEAVGKKHKGMDRHSRSLLVQERTFLVLTEALKERLCEDENVDIVMPAAYFSAKQGIPSLYAKHLFARTWQDHGDEDVLEAPIAQALWKNKSNTILWLGRGALSVNVLAFTGIFFYHYRRKRRKKE